MNNNCGEELITVLCHIISAVLFKKLKQTNYDLFECILLFPENLYFEHCSCRRPHWSEPVFKHHDQQNVADALIDRKLKVSATSPHENYNSCKRAKATARHM